ncbi:hypothetical protein [Burkholderia sp. SIMBA_062]|uniref:hypothetical protein n=1 Tax=Burkholderia sp. SIMBA_062 TaxID=3085803 RepID=UPI00397DDB39
MDEATLQSIRKDISGATYYTVNKAFGAALNTNDTRDSDGDRLAWGDEVWSGGWTYQWIFHPTEISNVFNLLCIAQTYATILKAGVSKDSDGDHKVYGHDGIDESRGDDRFRWIVHYLDQSQKVVRIENKYFGAYLKLGGKSQGSSRSHIAYAHEGRYENDDRFIWNLQPIS